MATGEATLEFLTPEWAAALEEAGQRSEAVRTGTEGVHLTVQQDVDGTVYAVEFADGTFKVHWGGVDDPDVTFLQSRETAAEVGRGSINAQQAFMAGKLRVRGDLTKLTAARDALTRLGDVFADVRARTRY